MSCPQKNLPEWKQLVENIGEINAYKSFIANGEVTPTQEQVDNIISKSKVGNNSNTLFGLDLKNDGNLEFHINTINVVSNFLENIGVQQRLVPQFLSQNGNIVEGAIASANFIKGTVDIIDNLEKRPSAWNKLPEEAAHWWYRLLDTNSELKKALWNSAKSTTKSNELILGKYGSLEMFNYNNLDVFKEEAIGQLIAEAIKRIEQRNGSPEDYSFFKKFLEWVKYVINIFNTTQHDPFEVAAMKILSSDISDLMSWDEYNTLNNQVYFADELTSQSTKPVDYTIIQDLGFIQNNGGLGSQFRFIDSEEREDSPNFNTQEELDNWVYTNIREYDLRQRDILNEVRDNQKFFDRLLNKTFRKRSKFLPKTLRKYYEIVDSNSLNQLPEWNISRELEKVTKELSVSEKETLIQTNGYTNIAPTLRVLPLLLDKYKKNPISLSEQVKVDGAKKQELNILNNIREMIKIENPDKKSITAEEFANEVHNWLETNYLLGFANEKSYLGYNIDQTFTNVRDRISDEPSPLANMTEEEIQRLPLAERQRIANIVGLTKQNPDVYHNKVSLRFNNKYHLKGGHFNYAPSAWGNLTYFYTGKSKLKDAVLLHEIQNDNIEFLREYKGEQVNLDESIGRYLQNLNQQVLENIQQIESGGKKLQINIPDSPFATQIQLALRYLIPEIENLSYEQGLNQFKERINELVNLYKGNPENDIEIQQKKLDLTFAQRRKFQNFKIRGGIKSILSSNELMDLKEILKGLNTQQEHRPAYATYDDGGGIDTVEMPEITNLNLREKKIKFLIRSQELTAKINTKLQKIYGKEFPLISLNAPAKPLPKAQRNPQQVLRGRETITIGNASQDLTENVNWLIAWNENKILSGLSKNIQFAKKQWLFARNQTASYNFNKQLVKITPDQYSTLIENYKYNKGLLKDLVNVQSNKDLKSATITYSSQDELNAEKDEQETKFESLKQKALAKKEELDKDYGKLEEEIKSTLEIELNYFTPLVHHLIQKHINQYGKDFPMYFSGYNITKLTQGSERTSWIYAGKDEVKFTEQEAKEIKYQAAQQIGLLSLTEKAREEQISDINRLSAYLQLKGDSFAKVYFNMDMYNSKSAKEQEELISKEKILIKKNIERKEELLKKEKVSLEEGIKLLNEYKRKNRDNLNRVINTIMNISNNKPIETGALYNAMSQVSGVKLIWQNSIEGLKGKPGGYKVDLSNYTYNTPVLYKLSDNKLEDKDKTNKQEISKYQEQIHNQLSTLCSKLGIPINIVEDILTPDNKQADGAYNTLSRSIKLTKEGQYKALPEEFFHMIVRWLGKDHPLIKGMLSTIESTEEYKTIYEAYKETYNNNEELIKEETLGQILAKVYSDGFSLKEKKKNNLLVHIANKIMEVIKKLFNKISNSELEKSDNEVHQLAKQITDKVLDNDLDYLLSNKSSDFNTNKENFDLYSIREANKEARTNRSMPFKESNLDKMEVGEKRITIRPVEHDSGVYTYRGVKYQISNLGKRKITDIANSEIASKLLLKNFVGNEDIKHEHIQRFFDGKEPMYIYQIQKLDSTAMNILNKAKNIIGLKPKKLAIIDKEAEALHQVENHFRDKVRKLKIELKDLTNTYTTEYAKLENINLTKQDRTILWDELHNPDIGIHNKMVAKQVQISKIESLLLLPKVKNNIENLNLNKANYEMLASVDLQRISTNLTKNNYSIENSTDAKLFAKDMAMLQVYKDIPKLAPIVNELEMEANFQIYDNLNKQLKKINTVGEKDFAMDIVRNQDSEDKNNDINWIEYSVGALIDQPRLEGQLAAHLIKDGQNRAGYESIKKAEEVIKQSNKLYEWAKSKGHNLNWTWEQLSETDSSGNLTLIKPYNKEFDKLLADSYNEEDPAKGKSWRITNSKWDESFKGRVNIDSKYNNPKYTNINLPENKPLKEFTDYFKEYMEYSSTILPITYSISNSKIPSFFKTMMDNIVDLKDSETRVSAAKGLIGTLYEQNLFDSEGNPVSYSELDKRDAIPVKHLNELPANQKSNDLGAVLVKWIQFVEMYKEMNEVLPQVRLIEKVIEDNWYLKGKNEIKGDKTNLLKMVREHIKMQVLGQKNSKDSDFKISGTTSKILDQYGDQIGTNDLYVSSLIDTAIKYTALLNIGYNPFTAVNNVFIGQLNNLFEASGGRWYSQKNWWEASAIILKDGYSENSKLNQIIRVIRPFQEYMDVQYFDELSRGDTLRNTVNKAKGFTDPFSMMRKGEYLNQGVPMVARLLAKTIKTKDGKTIKLWDAFKLNEKGELEWDKSTGIDVDFDKDPNGFIANIRNEVQRINQYIHGRYSNQDASVLKQHWWFRGMMLFRNWIPAAVESRFIGYREDSRLGMPVEGRYRTLANFIASPKWKDKEGKIQPKEAFGLYFSMLKEVWDGCDKLESGAILSELEVANMRKNILEIMTITTLLIIGKALSGGDDDKKRKVNPLEKFWLDQMYRLHGDLTQFVTPDFYADLVANPTPLMRTYNGMRTMIMNLPNIMGDSPDDFYRSGNRKGENKAVARGVEMLPAFKQVQEFGRLWNEQIKTYPTKL